VLMRSRDAMCVVVVVGGGGGVGVRFGLQAQEQASRSRRVWVREGRGRCDERCNTGWSWERERD
jgi:hypothetical protein